MVRSVFAVAGGTAIGQLFAIVSLPLITRMYGPENLGVYSVLFSATMILSQLTTWRLELAIPLVVEPADVKGLIRLSTYISAALCTLFGLAILAFGPALDDLSDLQLMPWLYALPAMVFGTGLFIVLSQALIHQADYSGVARRNVVGGFTTMVGQVGFGVLTPNASGLVAGFMVGRVVTVAVMARSIRKAFIGTVSSPMRPLAARFRSFATNFTVAGLLNSLGGQLPVLLMGFWFGAASAGYVGVTFRVLSVPSALIGGAISAVLLGEMARSQRTKGYIPPSMVRKALVRLLPLALLIAFVPLFLGPRVATLVLGPGWDVAGQYAQILGVVAATSMLASPLAQVLVVQERSRTMLAIDLLRVGLALGLGQLASALNATPTQTLSAISLGLVITYFGYIVAAWYYVNRPPQFVAS